MYKKVNIYDFITFTSKDEPDIYNINRTLSYLEKIIPFHKNEIEIVSNIDFKKNSYDLKIEDNFISICDRDIRRESINQNMKGVKGISFGNTDYIWIYKIEDEWFFVIIARSNIIPFHKNPYVLANRNSNFEFYKCDQIDGLEIFLREKLNIK